MSLLKRLLMSVTVAILAILAGTLAFSIGAARQYLEGQLQSESENTASSLALSLSQAANRDEVTRELLMTALFDSGQFRAIRLTSPEGRVLFERLAQTTAGGSQAPVWFSHLLPLREPESVREVTDGWRQVGRLSVMVSGGYARNALWRGAVRMTLLVVGAGAAWAVFVVFLLRWFRRVMREEISAQVRTIGLRNVASSLPGKPRVAELASVVHAITDTRERVRATVQEQTDRIESLQLEVNRDPVTQLPNRKYFMNELRRALQGDAGRQAMCGYVLLFRQRDLLALNTSLTRARTDEWLATVGERVSQFLEEQQITAQLARLNGSDFVVLMPGLEGLEAMRLVQNLRQTLQSLRIEFSAGQWCRWAYALTDYTPASTASDVLTRLDLALMRAESAGHGDVEYVAYDAAEDTRSTAVGESQWRQILAAALSTTHGLSLEVRDQGYAGASDVHQLHESTLLLHEAEGDTVIGSLFLPIATRLGMSADFDLRAIGLALAWLASHPQRPNLVVRISLASLIQAYFLSRIVQRLEAGEANPEVLKRLVLEIDAHGLVAYPDEVAAFCQVVKRSGVGVGVRRLDQQPLALTQLHRIKPTYVKMGGDFARQSQTNPGSRYLLSALVDAAASLDMVVYVTDVVDADTAAWLHERKAYIAAPSMPI